MDRVKEAIREQIFQRYHKEIPYRVEQVNAGWTALKDGSLRIDQELQVRADTEKGREKGREKEREKGRERQKEEGRERERASTSKFGLY